MTEPGPVRSPSGPENRKARRQRVLVGGLIVSRSGAQMWDCTVRDLSEDGARIRLAPGQVIPEHCFFVQLKDGIAYEATVRWLRLPEAGLQFTETHHLRDSTDPKYEHLRQLWMGRRMRTG